MNIPSLVGLFASLRTVGGELTFERLAGLESINGSALPALESAGSVSIATLDDVVAIEDLFPRLETITGGDCAAAATDSPTAAPTACVDSASWHKKNNPSKDCAWVGKHLPERCAVRGEEKFLSVYACVATCLQCGGESGPCDDDPSFYLYDDEWRESGAGGAPFRDPPRGRSFSPRGELRVPLAGTTASGSATRAPPSAARCRTTTARSCRTRAPTRAARARRPRRRPSAATAPTASRSPT